MNIYCYIAKLLNCGNVVLIPDEYRGEVTAAGGHR